MLFQDMRIGDVYKLTDDPNRPNYVYVLHSLFMDPRDGYYAVNLHAPGVHDAWEWAEIQHNDEDFPDVVPVSLGTPQAKVQAIGPDWSCGCGATLHADEKSCWRCGAPKPR